MVGIRRWWAQRLRQVMGIATLAMVIAFVGPAWGSQPRLEILSAATRVGDTPPEGWTHLVMKSVPRLASGEWDDLPTLAQKTATRFRTVILADVEGLGLDQQFILTRVGIGICIPNRDGKKEDIVVSSDRLESLSVKLSTVDQIVLDAVESELAEARIISRTSTFALLRTPATMLVQGKHSKVDLYYAFCVDPTTGRLRVGVWSMWPPATVKQQPPPPEVMSLAPKTTFDCELDVHAKRGARHYPLFLVVRDAQAADGTEDQGDQAAGREDRGRHQAADRRRPRGAREDAPEGPLRSPRRQGQAFSACVGEEVVHT